MVAVLITHHKQAVRAVELRDITKLVQLLALMEMLDHILPWKDLRAEIILAAA
jgi:hypothetical protein